MPSTVEYVSGYIAVDMTFCGSVEGPESSNYSVTECPPYRSCDGEVNYNFWKAVSTQVRNGRKNHIIAETEMSILVKILNH